MVVPPLELCFWLGYQEGIEYLPSRGLPKLLLDDLKAFVQDKSFSESVESLSAAYLAAEPAGLKHEPPRTACQLAEMLTWPKDQLIITDLLSQLLKYVMESNAPQTQIVDLTDGEIAETEQAGVPVLAQCDHNKIEFGPCQISTSQAAGPITRLHLRDPAMTSGLQTAGFSEPFPVTASNKEHLIQMLEGWMTSHPDNRPPASRPLSIQHCGYRFRYAKELTFGCTYEPVWVERVRISASHMAFFLMDDDGTCMLVDANYANNHAWRGYHGWLGADLGFTLQTIAQTGFAVEWHPDGLIEDLHPEDSGGIAVTHAPHLLESIGEEQSIEKTVSIRSGTTKAERQVAIKKEPRRNPIRHANIRPNHIDWQTDEEGWSSETPPLSSLGVVKKQRWPAQYVSPPPTPQSQKHLRGGKKLPKSTKSSISQSSRHKRCSSPKVTSVGIALASSQNAQPGNMNGNNLGKTKGRPRKKARKDTAGALQMPISPVSPISLPFVTRATAQSAPKANVILHFFLQRKELGALPTPLAQCDTVDKFFNHAEEAWGFLFSAAGTSVMAAVSVEVEGVEWPMIIPWRDPLAHQWMMETIAKAAIGKAHDLHVQVKCITK